MAESNKPKWHAVSQGSANRSAGKSGSARGAVRPTSSQARLTTGGRASSGSSSGPSRGSTASAARGASTRARSGSVRSASSNKGSNTRNTAIHGNKRGYRNGPIRADKSRPASNSPIKSKSTKAKWTQRLGLGFLSLFLLGLILVAGGLLYLYATTEIPDPNEFAVAETTNVYYADEETEMGTLSEYNREIINTETLPDYVGYAVVASEDRTFFTNSGIDFKGLLRALWNNLTSDSRQGGSTLSQQYIENYYVGETTTDIPGKIREAILALKINRQQSKDQILENYLNTVYFGRGAYGIQAAAQAYFGKDAADLTLSEAAMLSGIMPAPSVWDPSISPEQAQIRWERVLALMVADGWISQEEADEQTFPDTIDPTNSATTSNSWEGYLIQQIRSELIENEILTAEQIDSGGYQVVATIDYDLQVAAQESVEVMPEDTPDNLRIALSSIDNSTGAILAEYAGTDYSTIQSNSVTQDIAMAGSTFKPFALISYVKNGGSVYDTFNGNSPQTFYDVEVSNNDGVSYGTISLVNATRYSVNTAFTNLNEEVGADSTLQNLIAAGMPEDTLGLDSTLLNVLGYASPHNIDLAHVYSTIASGGVERTPYIVQEVRDPKGEVIYTASSTSNQAFDTATIASIMPALQAVTNSGTTTGNKVGTLHVATGGKTGTSENQLSAQFVGFTPSVTTAVSMYQVSEDGSSESLTNIGGLDYFYGSDWPVDVWVEYMKVAVQESNGDDSSFSWLDDYNATRSARNSSDDDTENDDSDTQDSQTNQQNGGRQDSGNSGTTGGTGGTTGSTGSTGGGTTGNQTPGGRPGGGSNAGGNTSNGNNGTSGGGGSGEAGDDGDGNSEAGGDGGGSDSGNTGSTTDNGGDGNTSDDGAD